MSPRSSIISRTGKAPFFYAVMVSLGLSVSGCSKAIQEQAQQTHGELSTLAGDQQTALDKYVTAPDTNYSFHLVRRIPGKGQITFILEMTSQAWLTTNEVDRPVWKHWLILTRPDNVNNSKSLLYISGGANDGKEPKSADGSLANIAMATKSVVTELKMVP